MRRIKPDDLFDAGSDVVSRYQYCLDFYTQQRDERLRGEWRFTTARGVLFLLGLAVAFFAWNDVVSWWLIVVPLAIFVRVAGQHEQYLREIHALNLLRGIYLQHRARYERRWPDVVTPEIEIPESERALARDLDLVGRASLFQWLSVANTPMGRETLRDWLLYPAEGNEIAERQRQVRAMAREFSWRESLELDGKLLGATTESTAAFVDWATGKTWLERRTWRKWTVRALPLAVIGVSLATAMGQLSPLTGFSILGGLLAFHGVLCVLDTGSIQRIFIAVAGRTNQVRRYRTMLEIAMQLPARVGNVDWNDEDLRSIAEQGVTALRQLDRIMAAIAFSQTFLFGVPHFVLHLILLWEFHLLSIVELWQRRWGSLAPRWFGALGRLEALASLATVASEHPDWVFPRIEPGTDMIRAAGLGHPLLPNPKRVVNDVELGPPGTFLLVTGSNMSGKSTLLRSVGVNVVLAQAGSVVCAREMAICPLDVQTSMRVSDSLADGVSFYLAELLRMKTIVDHARADRNTARRLLYLLDEVLHGTNSRERQIAVARVVGHLVRQGGIGAVTTHDLELASHPELVPHCRVVHFRETLGWDDGKRVMSFDYRMRPGLASTSNALTLLEMVGLTEDPQ